jgi:hypothetical protein
LRGKRTMSIRGEVRDGRRRKFGQEDDGGCGEEDKLLVWKRRTSAKDEGTNVRGLFILAWRNTMI